MLTISLDYNRSDITLSFAAHELQHYLPVLFRDAALAAQPHITLHVILRTEDAPGAGKAGFRSFDDSYRILAEGRRILLRGSNSRSVLLAVYRLLTELGCLFPAPGRECERIPSADPDSMRVSLEETASFRHRGVCIEGADSIDNILDFIDWLPKVGFNSFFVQHSEPEAFLNRWYGHLYNPMQEPEKTGGKELTDMFRRIDRAMALRGLLHHRVGHGWTSRAAGFSKACVPAGENAGPEISPMLALVNGKREFFGGIPSNTNLCYSNPRARHQFVDCVVRYAVSHPEIDYLHVWLADECNNICECPDCRHTTPADQYVSLLNEIDAGLTAKRSDTRIALLIYQELLWPPLKQRLISPQRFTVMFAPISRTFERSYARHGEIPPVPPYVRNRVTLPSTLEENISFLKEWQKNCPSDSFVYDYPLGRAHYGDLGYILTSRIIAEDVKYLKELGLNGYISCQELRAALPNALPNYVMGRLLWNMELPVKGLTEEYFRGIYGEGFKEVLEYLSAMSKLSSPDYFNGIGPRQNPVLAKRFHEAEKLASYALPLIHARAGAESGMRKIFWSRLDYHAGYCILLTRALSALASGEQEKAQAFWQEFMNYIRRMEPEYQSSLDVYRVLEVATKFTGFTLDVPRWKG